MLVEAGSTNKDSITFTLKGYEPLAVRATLKEDGTIVKERINRIEESIKLRKETNRLCKGLKLNKVKTILCFAIILISLLITVILKNHMIIMALVFLRRARFTQCTLLVSRLSLWKTRSITPILGRKNQIKHVIGVLF